MKEAMSEGLNIEFLLVEIPNDEQKIVLGKTWWIDLIFSKSLGEKSLSNHLNNQHAIIWLLRLIFQTFQNSGNYIKSK